MAYSMDTKVGDILDDTGAVKILEKHVPGISKNPMIGLAKGMTLKQILAMPQAKARAAALAFNYIAARRAVSSTFNMVTVDGDMSTNDCVLALANGLCGNARITEAGPDLIHYQYELSVVTYFASQDVSALLASLPADPTRLVGAVSVKYDLKNPANSIVLCEEWSGLPVSKESRDATEDYSA